MKRLKILVRILKVSRADRILVSYLVFVGICALLIVLIDPTISRIGDALWYLYAVISTAGFGDVVVSGLMSRIISVLVTVYSLIVIAVITGVIVNYYMQMLELKNKETLAAFLDRLEHLPELSEKEIAELSEKVKKFRGQRGGKS